LKLTAGTGVWLGWSDNHQFAQKDEARLSRWEGSLDPKTHIENFDPIIYNTILQQVDAIFKGIRIEVKVISDTALNAESRREQLKELAKVNQTLVIGPPKGKSKLLQVTFIQIIW